MLPTPGGDRKALVLPGVSLGIFSLFPDPLPLPGSLPPFFGTVLQIGLVCTGYLLFLLLFHKRPDHSSNSTVT